jgi:hypothetical protein
MGAGRDFRVWLRRDEDMGRRVGFFLGEDGGRPARRAGLRDWRFRGMVGRHLIVQGFAQNEQQLLSAGMTRRDRGRSIIIQQDQVDRGIQAAALLDKFANIQVRQPGIEQQSVTRLGSELGKGLGPAGRRHRRPMQFFQ